MGSDVVDGSFQYSAAVIHGDKTLSQRQRALNRFKKHDRTILFATDVVARGIDVKGVTHVCQLAPSYDTADYVHKAGRTGRNGANGTALYLPPVLINLSFANWKKILKVDLISKLYPRMSNLKD